MLGIPEIRKINYYLFCICGGAMIYSPKNFKVNIYYKKKELNLIK